MVKSECESQTRLLVTCQNDKARPVQDRPVVPHVLRRSFLAQCVCAFLGLTSAQRLYGFCWRRKRRRGKCWADDSPQARLRLVAAEDISKGLVTHDFFMVVNGKALDVLMPEVWDDNSSFINTHDAVRAQYMVEAIRHTLHTNRDRDFWAPYFDRIERAVSARLASEPEPTPPEPTPVEMDTRGRRRGFPDDILWEAVDTYASNAGVKVREFKGVLPRIVYEVIVTTTSGNGEINIIPRTEYNISLAIGRRPEFRTYNSGQRTGLGGHYYYYVEEKGRKTDVRTVVIDSGGSWSFRSP